MINETLLRKHIESGLSDDEIMRAQIAAERAKIEAEAERRQNVIRIEEARTRKREASIQEMLELAREAEEAAEEHAEVFRQREEMLKESARAEGKARGRWYQIFLQFSKLSKAVDDDSQRVDAELRSRGATVDAARENIASLQPSDVFNGLVLSGEFREELQPERSEQEKMVEALQLAAVINSAREKARPRGDYGDIGSEPPPKKAA